MTLIEPIDPGAQLYATRRNQLRALIDLRSGGNISAFADQFGYSRPRVSQFLSETYSDGRSIGERAARALEEAVGLPFGWLDGDAAATASADQALRTRMLQLAGEVTMAREQAAADAVEFARLRNQLLAAEARKFELERQVLMLFGPAGAQVDHAAELRRAISEERHVFEDQPGATDVLAYIDSVLAASAAPLHADDLAVDRFAGEMKSKLATCRAKGRSGWDDPAQCEVQHLVELLGAAFEKGDLVDIGNYAMMAHARGAAPAQISQELRDRTTLPGSFKSADELCEAIGVDVAAGAPVPAQTGMPGGGTASTTRETHTSAGEALVAGAADQAAAAMAAESAQLVIDAEKSAAAAARAAVGPLAVLSREVFSLSDKLQQPADLVVQLLALAELRSLRADHERAGRAAAMVLS